MNMYILPISIISVLTIRETEASQVLKILEEIIEENWERKMVDREKELAQLRLY